MTGFIGTLGAPVSAAATDVGHLGWLLSFTISFFSYGVICHFWPTRNQRIVKEMGLAWEEMASVHETIDGIETAVVEEVVIKDVKA